jgi:hypothetical protein
MGTLADVGCVDPRPWGTWFICPCLDSTELLMCQQSAVSHGLDQSGYNRVVQAHVIEVRELVRGGALIEAVGMRFGWGS